jgi:AraC family transcriptional regulator
MLTRQADQSAAPLRHGTVSGSTSQLLLSSKLRDWRGIVLEVFRGGDVDLVAEYREPVVALILGGSARLFQSRGRHVSERTVRPGDMIISPIGEPKVVRHREVTHVLKLHLARALVENIFEDVGVNRSGGVELLDNFGTRDIHLENIARRILAEFEGEGLASAIYVQTLANELAVHLLRYYSTASQSMRSPTNSLLRNKLRQAIEYINDNLRDDLTLESISETLAMSPYRFAHGFKLATGIAPHRYVIERRIERAQSLLRETDLSITQVAQEVGYATQSHFSVVFHRFTGQTPRSYRNGFCAVLGRSPVPDRFHAEREN